MNFNVSAVHKFVNYNLVHQRIFHSQWQDDEKKSDIRSRLVAKEVHVVDRIECIRSQGEGCLESMCNVKETRNRIK